MSNYFKVVGPGMGKASDCFPFSGEIQRLAAAYAAISHRASHGGTRIAVWQAIPSHPEYLVIGDTSHVRQIFGEDGSS